MLDVILAFLGLVTRRRYEADMARAAQIVQDFEDKVKGLSKGKAALERQTRTDSREIERLRENCKDNEADRERLRGACREYREHMVRLVGTLHVVRQVLDEAGVPCRHELEESDEEDEVSPDEIAQDDHRY